MRVTKRAFAEGEVWPWWYGVAYYDVAANEIVGLPVPLNLAARWLRRAWQKVAWACRGTKTDYTEGYGAGFQAGLAVGRRAGVVPDPGPWQGHEDGPIIEDTGGFESS